MTLQQTVTIPADRRLYVDLPRDTPTGEAEMKLVLTSARPADSDRPADEETRKAVKPRLLTQAEFDAGLPCPMDHSKPNAVTIAAMQEVQDIIDGKIPAALTLDLSGYKTKEEQLAAMRAAFDALEIDDDEDED